MADLNIGIAQAIWALTPFMAALVDWFINGDALKTYHVVGMGCLVACAVFVSLSEIILPPKQVE